MDFLFWVSNINYHFILVHGLAVITWAFYSCSFHGKTRRIILFFQLTGLLLMITHWVFLSAWSGVAITSTNAIITVFFIYKDKVRFINNIYFLLVSIIAIAVATSLTWKDWQSSWFSLFAMLGVVIILISKWQDGPQRIRALAILSNSSWVVYALFAGSWGLIMAEIIATGSIIWSMVKNESSPKKI